MIYGSVGLYKGFVPQKNLDEIEMFFKNYNVPKIASFVEYGNGNTFDINMDDYYEEIHTDYYHVFYLKENKSHCFQQNPNEYDGVNFYGSVYDNQRRYDGRVRVKTLEIVAPASDFDLERMDVKDFKITKQVKDPIVLQPVIGGYLIITKWGPEASDPETINGIEN